MLETIERDGLLAQVKENGSRLLELFEGLLQRRGQSAVREVRGAGLMVGIELFESAVPLQQRLQEAGSWSWEPGPRVLRLLPPLVTPWEELERLAHAIAWELS